MYGLFQIATLLQDHKFVQVCVFQVIWTIIAQNCILLKTTWWIFFNIYADHYTECFEEWHKANAHLHCENLLISGEQ